MWLVSGGGVAVRGGGRGLHDTAPPVGVADLGVI